MTPEAPSRVVTFLFTDIEGSTRRWEADAEAMRTALTAHDELLRSAIEAHGGFLFKHTGDGVCSVFNSPRAAVDAAVAAQRTLDLPVRMGIATGEAELRGGDYFGAVLNRAARVMAAGHGGQILLDGLTAGLLRGADLVDLGPRRLRDITDSVPIFQVRAPGLRTEFPPLSTLDAVSGNLRVPTTSLIGREKELGEVAAALKAHQVVTVTGPGGVGKTRLALEVAARSAEDYPDGVWVIELAPVGDPAAVPEAFAAVLGIIQQPGLSLADSVAAALEGRSRLLVVDNCEHLTDAAAEMIENILSRSTTVSVLATSRQGLQVADEQLWPLPALDTAGVESAAVSLFVERAQAVVPGLTLGGPEDAGAVVDICRRLDGIPLAIELAAARLVSMTVTEVRDRLDDRFRLLVGSRRGQGRHHTLRHAVAWSYDLLDDTEKTLLTRCSVFAGVFEVEGSCAVNDSDDEFATLDLLDALVRKSLLVADRSSGRTRFSMLETIRQFAGDQLVQTGEADEVRAAHARYFADQETRVMSLWDSPRQREAYDWFTAELANLRAAFRWAADHDDLDAAAAIATFAAALGLRVNNYEAIAWAEELIEPARAADHPRLAALYVMASLCWNPGRFQEAVRYSDAAQLVIGSGGHEEPFADEGWLGTAYVVIGQPERMVEWCRTRLARGSDTLIFPFTTACLVVALAFARCGEEARASATGLIDAAEATRNPFALSWALYAHGHAFRDTDPAAARDALRRGLVIAQDSGNRFTESLLAAALSRLGGVYGDPLAALDHITLAIRNFHEASNATGVRSALSGLAALFDRLGRYEPAATVAGFAVNPFTTVTAPELGTVIAHLRDVLGDETAGRRIPVTGIEQASPSGVVTFLFTDIEGSTRRWEADPEVMRAALADHDEVLRTAIESHGGGVFKHTGDGVCAVFTSPRAAVVAAMAAQLALELPVRMGIATGEAELRGGDYFGAVLNRAARVMAAGHGGQILLDGLTAGLLRGADLVDLGPRRLRDITQPVQVFQVRAEGLRAEFPPLRTLDPTPGNLRPAASSLIGRDVELRDVAAAVREHRVVTLTGTGGVGKTRLALEVATELAEEFRDGVWVFELASVTDAAAVPDAVAAVLGITQQPGKTVADSVAAALEGRVRLLVFDNCEHVLDAAADLIEAILAQSATVRVLATSREGLGAADEQVWPVPSLDVQAGTDSAAVRLFAERAHSVVPQFSLSNAVEAGAVVTICRRLDGLPLAIELAASRMASMTAGEVRDRLDDRFRLLVGSRRSLSRHQTLRHAVAWSYDLLGDDEKALLARCSVFAGGFDLQSACAVADSGDDYAVLDRLDALVRKSLLVADRSSGHTRYSMLETIRQFAEDQLVAHGEASETRTAHSRYFAGREADILALWDSPRQREAYDWFNIELPNLRTAFRWAADQGDLNSATTIATYATFLGIRVNNYEPITWAEELIASARVINHPRLGFLYVMASTCWNAGRIEQALRYADTGQSVIASGHHDVLPYGIGGMLGVAYLAIGQRQRCVEWCRDQLARDHDTHGYIRSSLIVALSTAGFVDEARAAASGLIEAAEATNNPWSLSFALWAHGWAFLDTDPTSAHDTLRRGFVIAQDSGNRANASLLANGLARLEAEHGNPHVALDHLTLAIRNYRDSGNTTMIRAPLAVLAIFLERLGWHEVAATIAGFSVSPLTTTGFPGFNSAVAHLRDVLGDQTYESLARTGEKMTTAAMATYAFDQIDRARAALTAVSE